MSRWQFFYFHYLQKSHFVSFKKTKLKPIFNYLNGSKIIVWTFLLNELRLELYYLSNKTEITIFFRLQIKDKNWGLPFNFEFMEDQPNMANGEELPSELLRKAYTLNQLIYYWLINLTLVYTN